MPQQSTKRSKRPDNRPARDRYWRTHQLRAHKVRNLVRCCKMGTGAAMEFWIANRKGRIKGTA